MKKIILLSLTYLLGNLAFSQTIVPSTPTKKTAILEEYTGIYCTWCPDGHKVANELAVANLGKFYAINIHQGASFSIPKGSDPDFRTPFGNTLGAYYGISGWPAGIINRRSFSGTKFFSTDREVWKSRATAIIAEDSPVNIAINASLDPTNRELTVLVELYYTDSAAAVNSLLENHLTVAVLQDNILGPQIGGNQFNPTAMRGNLYNHTHMLRTFLTAQWGDIIKVKKGFIAKTITHTVPANYSGIPVKIEDLSVVAFITKTQDEILTGAKDSDLLPSTYFAELTATYTNPTDKSWCSTTPKNIELTVTNNGKFTITDFKASLTPATSNGTTPANIVKTFSGALAPKQSTKLNFSLVKQNQISSFFFPGKLYGIKATGNQAKFNKAGITGPTPNTIFQLSSDKVTSFPLLINFEGRTGEISSNVYRTSNLSNPFVANSNSRNLGGFGNSKQSLFFNFFQLDKDAEISIVLQRLDLSSLATDKAGLRFAYAHTLATGNELDKLSVEVSTDCGANWASIWSKTGDEFVTAPNSPTSRFLPTATQWKEVALPLNSYAQSEVLIKFKGVSGYGNSLLIDDIKISPQVLSTNELFSGKNSFTIFPNPGSNQITLSLIPDKANKTENQTVVIRIFDIIGRDVFKSSTTIEKLRNYKINTQEFAQGIYFVEVSSNNQNKTTKLVIQ